MRDFDNTDERVYKISSVAIYCTFVLEDFIITGGKDQSVTFWELTPEGELSRKFRLTEAHHGSVLCMKVDSEWDNMAGLMITGGSDGSINVWNLDGIIANWNCKPEPFRIKEFRGHTGGVLDLALRDNRVFSW
jgi:WD40 repeat protein